MQHCGRRPHKPLQDPESRLLAAANEVFQSRAAEPLDACLRGRSELHHIRHGLLSFLLSSPLTCIVTSSIKASPHACHTRLHATESRQQGSAHLGACGVCILGFGGSRHRALPRAFAPKVQAVRAQECAKNVAVWWGERKVERFGCRAAGWCEI